MTSEGVYTDGRTARRREVQVAIEPPYLTVRGDEDIIRWRLDELDVEFTSPDHLRVLHPQSGAQVSVDDPGDFGDRLAERVGVSWDRRLMRMAGTPYTLFLLVLAGFGLIATMMLSIGRFAGVAAHWIPRSWMNSIGRRISQQVTVGATVCENPEATRNIRRIARSLNNTGSPITVTVVDRSVPNAVTVPGGSIVLFDGLFSFVRGPNEFSGVLAHEIAHVVHRDPTESLVRSLGYQFFWTATIGDGSNLANYLVNTSYSRSQERRADRTALRLLHGAEWTSTGLQHFLRRLAKKRDSLPVTEFLSTHPLPAKRAKWLSNRSRSLRSPLSDTQWETVKSICESE